MDNETLYDIVDVLYGLENYSARLLSLNEYLRKVQFQLEEAVVYPIEKTIGALNRWLYNYHLRVWYLSTYGEEWDR